VLLRTSRRPRRGLLLSGRWWRFLRCCLQWRCLLLLLGGGCRAGAQGGDLC